MARPDLARLKSLFTQLVDLPSREQEAELAALSLDRETREQLRRMLAADVGEASAATRLREQMSEIREGIEDSDVAEGDQLGVWQLGPMLGRGGMGAVFAARRTDGQFKQEAAIKVLQGRPSPQALALLSAERQILARLAHPHIARLLDGGSTPKGRPYLVMEQVQGKRLDQYLSRRPLPLEQRLLLFQQMCAAVAYAHAQLVVHCDLKPSNILVDQDGQVSLLDFGIARLLDAGISDDGSQVAKAYTPGYASPELQNGDTVGAASDVYSLGIILKEMLGQTFSRNADMQAIITRATRTDPAKRYESVTLLAQDVEHFRHGYPVRARGGGWLYRGSRMLRRRWPAFAGVSLFLLTVCAFSWRLLVERDAALDARALADQEAAAATASNEFLQSLFAGADVEKDGSRELTALTLVDRGWQRVESELADQPATQASMYAALAQVYTNLGVPERAELGYERAIEAERRVDPPRPLALSSHLRNAAVNATFGNRHGQAAIWAGEALDLAERFAPPVSRDVGNSATALALALKNSDPDQAEQLLQRHLQIRQALGEPEIDLASTWHNLALVASFKRDYPTALDYYQRVLAAKRRDLGAEHARTLNSMEALAWTLTRVKRYDEAQRLLGEALLLRRRINGPGSAKSLHVATELALVDGESGDYVRCVQRYREVLDNPNNVLEPSVRARYLNNLGTCHDRMGEPEAAIAVLRRSLDLRLQHYPAGDLAIARVQGGLGRMLSGTGKSAEAQALLLQSESTRAHQLAENHEEVLGVRIALADWARNRGDLAQAQERLQQLEPALAQTGPVTLIAAERLRAELSADLGAELQARSSAERLLAIAQQHFGAGHPQQLRAAVSALGVYRRIGDRAGVAAALEPLSQQVAALPQSFPPSSTIHAELDALREWLQQPSS